MAEVAVCDSPSRPLAVELFDRLLTEYDTEHVSISPGDIGASVPEEKLSRFRALYIRVGDVTESTLEKCSNLEIVATCGSGYDHIDVGAATERNVLVTHTPGAPAPGAIEHVFGLLFSLLHDLPELYEATSNGEWEQAQRPVAELYNRRLGVVGLGTIGKEVAITARERFDAEVIAYDPYVSGERQSEIYPRVTKEEVESHGIRLVEKSRLFESADVVTLHVPLTGDTEGFVGEAELEALSNGYLINTSRGGVVDESALIAAVERDQLRGVALDVMSTEPPGPSNPLLSSPDVLVTPHVAGGSEGYTERSARINADRISTALCGDRPGGLVNPSVLDSAE